MIYINNIFSYVIRYVKSLKCALGIYKAKGKFYGLIFGGRGGDLYFGIFHVV